MTDQSKDSSDEMTRRERREARQEHREARRDIRRQASRSDGVEDRPQAFNDKGPGCPAFHRAGYRGEKGIRALESRTPFLDREKAVRVDEDPL